MIRYFVYKAGVNEESNTYWFSNKKRETFVHSGNSISRSVNSIGTLENRLIEISYKELKERLINAVRSM